MRTGRKWTFLTAGIAALSIGLDAAAQKHLSQIPRTDLTPGGPRFEPRQPPGLLSGHPGKGSPVAGSAVSVPISVERGSGAGPTGRGMPGVRATPGQDGVMPEGSYSGGSRGESQSKDPPGHRGAMPGNANKDGSNGQAKGREEFDPPGENVQVSAGQAESAFGRRALHQIPTCR